MVKNLKKKSFHKYLLCLLTGMLIVGSISVYAVSTIIDSKEVSYDNENSKGSYDNVQSSIDELCTRDIKIYQVNKIQFILKRF